MRISSLPPVDLLSKYVQVRSRESVYAQRAAGADRVDLTGDARIFSSVMKAAREMTTHRTAEEQQHIQDVTARIRNHTYSVPGRKVAERILNS